MLKDKIVLVTGASAGIGAACAVGFAREGARLILAARRLSKLGELQSRLESEFGVETHLLELDVRDRERVNAAVEGLPEGWAEIDILVNDAGLSRGLDKVQEGSWLDWDEMIDTNVKGLQGQRPGEISLMVQDRRSPSSPKTTDSPTFLPMKAMARGAW